MCGNMHITWTIATNGRASPPACCRTSSTGTSSRRTSTARASSERTSRAPKRRSSLLKPVAGLEHPGDDAEAERVEGNRHQRARPDGDVVHRVEAPSEAAD